MQLNNGCEIKGGAIPICYRNKYWPLALKNKQMKQKTFTCLSSEGYFVFFNLLLFCLHAMQIAFHKFGNFIVFAV